jgi:hypothetical protein
MVVRTAAVASVDLLETAACQIEAADLVGVNSVIARVAMLLHLAGMLVATLDSTLAILLATVANLVDQVDECTIRETELKTTHQISINHPVPHTRHCSLVGANSTDIAIHVGSPRKTAVLCGKMNVFSPTRHDVSTMNRHVDVTTQELDTVTGDAVILVGSFSHSYPTCIRPRVYLYHITMVVYRTAVLLSSHTGCLIRVPCILD